MNYFLLSSFSLMALVMMMTAALFVFGLWNSTGKVDYKKWLIVNLLALLFWHGMGFFSAGLHPDLRELTYRYTNTLFNAGLAVSVISFTQVAYLFPVGLFERERRWTLGVSCGLGAVHVGSIIWFHFIQDQRGLSSTTYGLFANTVAGLFTTMGQIWSVVVLLRKSRYFSQHSPALRAPSLLLAMCPVGLSVIAFLMVYPGPSQPWVMLVYSIGFWLFLQMEMLIFTVYSTFPIRFRDKLVGFTFASVMCILSVIIMVVVPFTTNSIDPRNIAQRITDQPILIRLLWVALGSAAFVLTLFPLILRVSFMQPLQRLMRGIQQANRGNLSVQVEPGMLDEIGIVTQHFNHMAQSLKLSNNELTAYAETLEQRVNERTRQLNEQADQLRELDGVKSRFFTNITHEFRTPLTLILGPAEQVLAQTGEDKTRRQVGLMQRNARRLLQLINQLLDLSKLEAGKLALSTAPGDLIGLVKGTLLSFESLTGQKQITLRFTANRERLFMPIDRDKLEKILYNLFSNAIKFTNPGGEIWVTITCDETDERGWAQLSVQDTGIGIPVAKLPYIFDRFYQADGSDTRQQEGTGIGLAITKELVELHGGSLHISSQPGVGTTVTVRLPTQSGESTERTPGPPSVGRPAVALSPPSEQTPEWTGAVGQQRNGRSADAPPGQHDVVRHPGTDTPLVLLIEDNEEVRAFIRSSLSDHYQIIEAANGEEGVWLGQEQVPDLVITDLMMPQMNGYQVCATLRQDERTSHIPLIMLTAKADLDSKLEGLETGADSYLAKPFNQRELLAQISNLITRQQKLGEYYRRQFALPGQSVVPVNSPGVDSPVSERVDILPDPFLLRIYALLEGNLADPLLGVDWLADQLAMNRKTLYRKVQSLIQLTPAELIRQYRLRRAAEWLGTGRNVAETADLAGFSTSSHFSTVFKEFYRQTPSEFITRRVKKA